MKKSEISESPDLISPVYYGHFIVAAAFMMIMVMYAAYYSYGVFFKPLLNEFGWSRAITSGAFSFSLIFNGLMCILIGGLSDRFGPKAILTLCAFLLGLGYFLMSRVGTAWQLYLFFGLIVGTGMSGSFVPVMSTVARWFVRRRSMMSGIIAAGIGVGAAVGPPMADRLIFNYGWRIAFIIFAVIVFAVVFLSAQIIKSEPPEAGQRTLAGKKDEKLELQFGINNFSFRQAVFSSKLWILFALFFCFGFCIFTVMVHIVPYATEQKISTSTAANILATIGMFSIFGKIVMGKAADKIGSLKIFFISIVVLTATLCWLVPARSLWKLYLFAVFFGFAYGGCVSAQSPLVALLFGLRSHGSILGITVFGAHLGGSIGPLVAGFMFDLAESYRLAFTTCAVTGLIGILLTKLLNKTSLRASRNLVVKKNDL